MNAREKEIIKLRRLKDKPKKLEELSKQFKISRERVRQIEEKAIEKIKKEIDRAKLTFKKYKWPTIDVTRKSVEEVAASIIKIHEIYKSNG